MPDKKSAGKQSTFIWYHAELLDEPYLKAWLESVKVSCHIHGQLFIRKSAERVTYMECYEDITANEIIAIETLASQQSIFKHIERRCESFDKIKG